MSAQPHLFPRIREILLTSLNGYLQIPEMLDDVTRFIAPPGLGTLAGPLGRTRRRRASNGNRLYGSGRHGD